jgi:hypothetical protein
MPRRMSLFMSTVPAIVAMSLATIPSGRAASDNCLAAPSHLSPADKHWRYRIDRTSHRKCWYLGPLGRKAHDTAAKSERPANETVAPVATDPAARTRSTQAASDSRVVGPAESPQAQVTLQPWLDRAKLVQWVDFDRPWTRHASGPISAQSMPVSESSAPGDIRSPLPERATTQAGPPGWCPRCWRAPWR